MGQPDTNVYQVRATSANTDTQVFRSPWLINRSYITQEIILVNESATPALVKIYDTDLLGSGVPPTSGNNTTNPILEFYVPANGNLFIDRKMCPHKRFIAGMVINSSQVPLFASTEIKED